MMATTKNNKETIILASILGALFLASCSDSQKKSAVKEHHNHSQSNVVSLQTMPNVIEAGTPAKLMFAFRKNDQKVSLDISHEMKMHLMVVNEELTWFRHIHPAEQPDSTFRISQTFPFGGKYFLFVDYKPQGATPSVEKKEIVVNGNVRSAQPDSSLKLVSQVDGYSVTLVNGNALATNRAQPLEISVQRDKKVLTQHDIQPYLGATAHIAMISQDDKEFLHLHPMSDERFPIYATTHIERAGVYRIWVEFKTDGKVHTADFTVEVKEGRQ